MKKMCLREILLLAQHLVDKPNTADKPNLKPWSSYWNYLVLTSISISTNKIENIYKTTINGLSPLPK